MHLFRIAAIASLAAFLSLPASAGGLRKQNVAASAQWVAHIDIEAIIRSKLFQGAMSHAAELEIDLNDLNEMKSQLGIDPLKDIKDATVYGSGDPEKGDMVVVISTNGTVDDALAKLKAHEMPLKEITVGDRTISALDQDGDVTYFVVRPGKSTDDRTVLVARSQEGLLRGMDVLEGKAENLSAAKSSPLSAAASPGSGSMFFAAAKGLPWMNLGDGDESEPASQLLKSSDRLSVDMGEDGAETYASLVIGTKTPEDATDVSDMLRGLMAMGRIAAGAEPELAEVKTLMNSVKLTSSGNDVRIQLRHNTEALLGIMQKVAAFAEAENDHDGKDDDHHDHHSKGTDKPDAAHEAPSSQPR